jgi:tetratricopeptide (TPR) repeat protein
VQEVRPLLDEAIRSSLARDPGLTQLLLMAEGRVLHAAGESADLYVERVVRALGLVPQSPPGRSAVLHTALTQAYGWAGLLREALQASETALQHIQEVDAVDAEFVGFSVELWLSLMRGRLLARLGHADRARECAEGLIHSCASTRDPVIMHMPHYMMVELGFQLGDAELVQRHRRVVGQLARQSETPYVRVFALRGEAMMHQMEQRAAGALQALNDALALVRSKVAAEFETELLADIAEAHRAAGQVHAAVSFAQQAAALSRLRGNRIPLVRALATWRDVLDTEPHMATREDRARLDAEIDDLFRRTGLAASREAQPAMAAARDGTAA